MVARPASAPGPGKVGGFKRFPLEEEDCVLQVRQWLGVKRGKYVRAVCGVYPVSTVIMRTASDPALAAKSKTHYSDIFVQSTKLSLEEIQVAMLGPDGAHPDLSKAHPKEVLFAGAGISEISSLQARIFAFGVYPVRLEMGILTLFASIRKISKAQGRQSPAMVLEIGGASSRFHVVGENGVEMTRPVAFGLDSLLAHVRTELGVTDDAVAKKILLANTFDFTEMAPTLLTRLMRELRAAIGFYEVGTGATLDRVYFANPNPALDWIYRHVTKTTRLEWVAADFERWPEAIGLTIESSDDFSHADPELWSLFSATAEYE